MQPFSAKPIYLCTGMYCRYYKLNFFIPNIHQGPQFLGLGIKAMENSCKNGLSKTVPIEYINFPDLSTSELFEQFTFKTIGSEEG
jgi:hypothetical protein